MALPCVAESTPASLPDAPQAHVSSSNTANNTTARDNTFLGVHVGPAYPAEAQKWDTLINPGERAQPLSAFDKVLYAGHEQIQPIILVPAIFSAAYGQLADANPHYGVDAGGYGERFGAAMLRQATDRISGDGVLPALFHQDPRYYRSDGPILHRGLYSVRQTILRRNDQGVEQINASGILGHAVANFLAITYYPHVSATTRVAAEGFGTSVAADAGGKLLLEFGPDLLRLAFRRNP